MDKPRRLLEAYDFLNRAPVFVTPEDAVEWLEKKHPGITRVPLEGVEFGAPIAQSRPRNGVVAEADPNQAVADLQPMAEVVGRDLVRPRLNMIVMTVFACAAVLLTGLGLYGVIAVTVASQTREIGLRLALGAEAGQVARWLAHGAGKMLVSGLAAGSVAGAFEAPAGGVWARAESAPSTKSAARIGCAGRRTSLIGERVGVTAEPAKIWRCMYLATVVGVK